MRYAFPSEIHVFFFISATESARERNPAPIVTRLLPMNRRRIIELVSCANGENRSDKKDQ